MDENLPRREGLSIFDSKFTGQPAWICQWPGNGAENDKGKIIIGGDEVGVLAWNYKDNEDFFIKTKSDGVNSYVNLYLNEYDAFNHKNCFICQMFLGKIPIIPLKSIMNPDAENIYGDWKPRNFISIVFLDYGANGKSNSLEKGEYKVGYLNKIYNSSLPTSVVINGKNGTAFVELQSFYETKLLLQEKIFDEQRTLNATEQFAAVLRGIENEDVTTYICNYFGHGRLNELEDRGVYLRFPHSGDGYWEDYFLKLNDKNFRTLEDGTVLSKQEKFIFDLGLTDKTEGFAIVPFKYNKHYVTLTVDCSVYPKTISMFDSSLYNIIGVGEKCEAFRDFLLGNPNILIENEIESCKFLLNHYDVQGGKLEYESNGQMIEHKDTIGCYNMGTCGFWTLAFCIEAAKCENTGQIKEGCNSLYLLSIIAKRMSAIIDGQDLIPEEQLINYEIPANSVCIPSYLGLNQGRKNNYCNRLRDMLIAVGPGIKKGTGHATKVVSEQELYNNTLSLSDLPQYLRSQPSFKQQMLETAPQKPKAKEAEDSYYWRNKFKNNSVKHSSSKGHNMFN